MEKIAKIKQKYGIKSSERSEYLTLNDHKINQKLLKEEFNKFFSENNVEDNWYNKSLYNTYFNELIKSGNYLLFNPQSEYQKVYQLQEIAIRYFYRQPNGMIITGKGIIPNINKDQIQIKHGSKNHIETLSTKNCIFIKPYTESQLELLNLQKYLTK